MKRNKGITLIALVITIIVLLILAGVSIAMLSGENGILTQATEAARKTAESELEEFLDLAYTGVRLKNDSTSAETTMQQIQDELESMNVLDENINFVIDNEKTGALINLEYGIMVTVTLSDKGTLSKTTTYPEDLENLEFLNATAVGTLDLNTERQVFIEVNASSSKNITKIVLKDSNGNVIEEVANSTPKVTKTFSVYTSGTYEVVVIGEAEGNEKTIPVTAEIGKQPNTPVVSDGMIPIKWNGTDWEICEETDVEWYSYKAQKSTTENGGTSYWANIMLEDGTYKEGQAVGTVVAEADLGSMFVWIPRYGYSVTEGYHSPNTGIIEVEFLDGKTTNTISGNNITWDNASGEGNWNVHPAFTFGTNELEGFWVAKFEVSGAVEIVPNTVSTHSVDVNTIFNNSISMNNSGNKYGLNTNDSIVDPHMMKNMEWGAITYLTHSVYGRNTTELEPNDSETQLTGDGDYESNVKQSTTGNITGIYDLSAGRDEYIAAYVENATTTQYYSDLINADSRYKEVYNIGGDGSSRELNYEANKESYGDATYETSLTPDVETQHSWQGDYDAYPVTGAPVFRRGGRWIYGTNAGIFYYASNSGIGHEFFGYRPTIAVIN